MRIYTGQTTGEKLKEIKKRDMGIMISSSPHGSPCADMEQVPCALDNGAFPAYSKGYPFQADIFRETIKKCYKLSINLDFIVCPDIIAGGKRSLDLSLRWAQGELLGTPNLALVVQDGIKESDLTNYILQYFTYIFVGGTVKWKWKTAERWVNFANKNNMKCHIGQCGTLSRLRYAKKIGAHSVDSTNFTRNGDFRAVDEFLNAKQLQLI